MSATDVNTYVAAAIDAIEAEDFQTALRKLQAAKAALIALPDTSHRNASLNWNRDAIDSLILECRCEIRAADFAANATGGMLRTKVKYKDPVDE